MGKKCCVYGEWKCVGEDGSGGDGALRRQTLTVTSNPVAPKVWPVGSFLTDLTLLASYSHTRVVSAIKEIRNYVDYF